MMQENKKNTVNIVSNDAVVGKPYLDIDRVIPEGKSGNANHKK
ncbi:hypothetical protein [Neobacillus drentensis]|nr:hypothetical protein [Neobacillus drentensis]